MYFKLLVNYNFVNYMLAKPKTEICNYLSLGKICTMGIPCPTGQCLPSELKCQLKIFFQLGLCG